MMPVNTPCALYNKNKPKWTTCRVATAGEEAVKAAEDVYLPRLGANQLEPDYQAYKLRALYYGATGRTVEGLSGAIFRKSPQIPAKNTRIETELESVTPDYQDYISFASNIVHELIITGRVGALCDAPQEEGGVAYLCAYQTESIINWRFTNTGKGMVLSLVVLEEDYEEDVVSDSFSVKEKKQYRVLELVDNVYTQRLYRATETDDKSKASDMNEEYIEVEDSNITPQVGGRPLDYIPFIFVNAVDVTARIYDPPILALANVNLSHYRSSADLEHGRHFTGLPTAWVAGFEKTQEFRIGSQVAWVSEDADAHAEFLEFKGQGLRSLETALKEKQEQMAVLGARMLEDPKGAVESNKTLQTRYRGENNVLSNISKTASSALSTLFTWLLDWRGVTQELVVELNNDFINDRLGSAEVKDFMEVWQGGAISWETLFFNFKRGELYPEDVDEDEEKGRLETEMELDANSFTAPKVPGDGTMVDEEEEEAIALKKAEEEKKATALKKAA
jgi:hypothetical protein